MQKNKILWLAVVTVAASCTKGPAPKLVISQWDKSDGSDLFLERKLASSNNQTQCLKDVFDVETLKKQVKELERGYAGGKRVKGQWKHLNLEDLPIPQANFLKTYGDKIGDLNDEDAFDFSGCQDVPCIFNRIYKKENHIAGYVHYLWYLRFGHMLSADNKVPDQVSKPGEYDSLPVPFEDYLFSDKQLYGMWRLSMMLKTPHTSLDRLTELQKVPKGRKYEKPDYKSACGLASSAGWVTLTDQCLSIDDHNKDTGYLYPSVTHELSHQVDYHDGRKLGKSYRSQESDYLDIADMYLKEYVDEKGKNVRQWDHKAGIKLVTGYAGTSPAENFAESLAYFRVDGEKAFSNMKSGHYNFVSKNFYQDRFFRKADLQKTLLAKYNADSSKSAFQSVVECSKLKSASKSTYFKGDDFDYPLTPTMLNCLGARASEMAKLLKGTLALKEPEGCAAITGNWQSDPWEATSKEYLKGIFNQYVKELQNDKEYLARIEAFYAELKDKTIAREAYLSCYGELGEEQCFESEIKRLSLAKASSLKLPPEQTEEMASMYTSFHSFQNTRDELLKLYETLVSAHLESIREEGDDLWQRCTSGGQNDDETPISGNFSVGDGYLVSSINNCINSGFSDGVRAVIRNLAVNNQRIDHPKEEMLLTQEIKPELVKIIRAKYDEAREGEVSRALDIMSNDKGQLRKSVLSNFSWVSNVVDSDKILSDCKKQAYSLIEGEWYYTLKKDLFSKFTEGNVCQNVSSSTEFNQWMVSAKDQFSDKVVDGLEDKILAKANEKASQCLQQYPMDSAINKIKYRKQRQDCLINDWSRIEDAVLQDTMKDPVVVKFQIKREKLMGELELNRRRLQVKVMKERFN